MLCVTQHAYMYMYDRTKKINTSNYTNAGVCFIPEHMVFSIDYMEWVQLYWVLIKKEGNHLKSMTYYQSLVTTLYFMLAKSWQSLLPYLVHAIYRDASFICIQGLKII